MTVARGLHLLAMFASIAVVVIGLRAEQVRAAASIELLQGERVELRREAWGLELEIGRLRAPEGIVDRVARWSLDVEEPRPPSERMNAAVMMAAGY